MLRLKLVRKASYQIIALILLLCQSLSAQNHYVSLVPIGEVRPLHMDLAKSAIQDFYHLEVEIREPVEVKNEFIAKFDTILNANAINSYLAKRQVNTNEKLLAVTDWSLTIGERIAKPIRGYADTIGGVSATVSSSKVLSEANSDGSRTFDVIFTKVTNHELGHLFGLPHCNEDEECLMTYGNSFLGSKNELCQVCRNKLSLESVKK